MCLFSFSEQYYNNITTQTRDWTACYQNEQYDARNIALTSVTLEKNLAGLDISCR